MMYQKQYGHSGYHMPSVSIQSDCRIASVYQSVILAIFPLLMLYGLVSAGSRDEVDILNIVGPVYLIIVLSISAYRIFKIMPGALWSPLWWLLISNAVFFCLGPLVEIFGNEQTLHRLSISKFAVTSDELYRANVLSAIGMMGLFFGVYIHLSYFHEKWRMLSEKSVKASSPLFNITTLAISFIVIGLVFKHFIINPSLWGMIDLLIPGAFNNLGAIAEIGFALASYQMARGDKRMYLIMVFIWPVHLLVSSLSFAKMDIILALIFPIIGAFSAKRNFFRLSFWFFVVGMIFYLYQPLSAYSRGVIWDRTGSIYEANYSERVDIALSYFENDATFSSEILSDDTEGWWIRLNYAGPQAIAMEFYDNGMVGNTLNDVWKLFIPRFLWPDKPVFITPAVAFGEMVFGTTVGHMGLSVYADLYWNFGWFGVLLGMPLIGIMFSMMAIRTAQFVKNNDFVYTPIILLAMQASMSNLTRFVIGGIIAVIPLYIGYLIVVHLICKILQKKPNKI